MQINRVQASPQRKHAPQQNFGMITFTFVKPPIAKAAQDTPKYYVKGVQAFKEFFKGELTQGMFTQQLVDNSTQYGTKEEAKAIIKARKIIANSPFKHSVKVSATEDTPPVNNKKISETFHPDGSATVKGEVHGNSGLLAKFEKTIHPDRSSDANYTILNEIIGKAKSKPDGSIIKREKHTTDGSIWIKERNIHKGTEKTTATGKNTNGEPTKSITTKHLDGSSTIDTTHGSGSELFRHITTKHPDGSQEKILLFNGKKVRETITTAEGFETSTTFRRDSKTPLNVITTNPAKEEISYIYYNKFGKKDTERSYNPNKSITITTFHPDEKTPKNIKNIDPNDKLVSEEYFNANGVSTGKRTDFDTKALEYELDDNGRSTLTTTQKDGGETIEYRQPNYPYKDIPEADYKSEHTLINNND